MIHVNPRSKYRTRTPGFIHSVNQPILIEFLLCARLHARPREPIVKAKLLSLSPQSSHSSGEDITKYQQRRCLLAILSTEQEILV